jgi:NAD(P)-dependent dehydrogenase (short-subunit alcohol dehydrogenase family)
MTPGLVAYAATKGAIKMFAQGLAREVGNRGITVNNIQPGPIDTDLNPASCEWAVTAAWTTWRAWWRSSLVRKPPASRARA